MNPGPEMVERVARAIYEASAPEVQRTYNINSGKMVACGWAEQPERDHWFVYARAAISAMREPTEAMIEAGGKEVRHFDSRFETGSDTAADAWRTMIDGALS